MKLIFIKNMKHNHIATVLSILKLLKSLNMKKKKFIIKTIYCRKNIQNITNLSQISQANLTFWI